MLKFGSQDVIFKQGSQDVKVYQGSTLIYDPVPAGAWDLTQLSYQSNNFSVSAQAASPEDVGFNSNGSKMYALDSLTAKIYEYDLSSVWDVTTAVVNANELDVSGQDSAMTGFYIRGDGLKLYAVGQTNDKIYQYTISVAFDLSTATFDSVEFLVSGQEANVSGIFMQDDGSRVFITGNNAVHSYTLGTDWDISSAVFETTFSVAGQDGSVRGITMKTEGDKMYICGNTNNRIFQYTLSTPWVLSTASYDSVSLFVGSEDLTPTDMTFKDNGSILYMIGLSTDTVYAYEL